MADKLNGVSGNLKNLNRVVTPKGNFRKKPFRFNAEKDINLLKVVLSHRPWKFGSGQWSIVAKTLQLKKKYDVTGRTCRLHCEGLISAYQKKDKEHLRRSGTDEQYAQRDELLQEIIDRMDGESPVDPKEGDTWNDECLNPESVMVIDDVSDVVVSELSSAQRPLSVRHRELNDRLSIETDIDEEADEDAEDEETMGASPVKTKRRKFDAMAVLREKYALEKERNAQIAKKEAQELKIAERQLLFEERRLAFEERRLSLDERKHELEVLKVNSQIKLEEMRTEQMMQLITAVIAKK